MSAVESNTNERIFGALYALFEWTFDVRFSPDDKSVFETEVFQGWNNSDPSEQELIAYLWQLKKAIWSVRSSRRKEVKPAARQLFTKIFGIQESNDRGRVVRTLHSLVEGRAPGRSGLPGAPPMSVVPPLVVPARLPLATPAPVFAGTPGNGGTYSAPQSNYGATAGYQSGANQIFDQLRNAQREAQHVAMTSKLAALEHDTIMGIINNMR